MALKKKCWSTPVCRSVVIEIITKISIIMTDQFHHYHHHLCQTWIKSLAAMMMKIVMVGLRKFLSNHRFLIKHSRSFIFLHLYFFFEIFSLSSRRRCCCCLTSPSSFIFLLLLFQSSFHARYCWNALLLLFFFFFII